MMQFDPERLTFFFLTYPVFLLALSFHELAHAVTAKWGGDLTSAYQGRVTMNPFSHIDPVGTVLIPFLGAVTTGIPLIGWARPVPVVSINFRRGDNYGMLVALAGPFSNLLLALLTVVVMQVWELTRFLLGFNGLEIPETANTFLSTIIWYSLMINLGLMTFNLIPVPPLDGSHVLWHLFVKHRPALHDLWGTLTNFGFFILIGLIWVGAIGLVYTVIVFPLSQAMEALAVLPLDVLIWLL